jgi:hypothetical protein
MERIDQIRQRVNSKEFKRGRYYSFLLSFIPNWVKSSSDRNWRRNKIITPNISDVAEVRIDPGEVFTIQAAGDLPQFQCELLGDNNSIMFKLKRDRNYAAIELSKEQVENLHTGS